MSRTEEEQDLIEQTVDDLTHKTSQEQLLKQAHELVQTHIEQMLGVKNTPTIRARIRREVIDLVEDLVGSDMAQKIEVRVDEQDPTHVKVSIPWPNHGTADGSYF